MYRFKISEMAERGGVTAATLRYYDKKGILRPEYTDPNTGYRYYTLQQLFQLMVIQYMRSMGIDVESIKDMIGKNDVESIYQMLMFRRTEILNTMKTLRAQNAMISHLIDGYTMLTNHPPCGQPFLNTIGERYIYVYQLGTPSPNSSYLMRYEEGLIEMMESMLEQQIAGFGYINIGCIVPKERAENGDLDCARVYSAVKKEYANIQGVVLRKNMIYLCNICDEPEKEQQYMKMLYEECARRKLTAGDYYREEIIFLPDSRQITGNRLFLQAVPVGIDGPSRGHDLLRY